MRKSKHFRKDVIIARIIAALILIVLIALIVTVVSHSTKSSGNKDSQNTQSTQDVNNGNQDSEDKDTQNSEGQNDPSNDNPSNDDPSNDDPSNEGSNTPQGSEEDTDVVEKVYVKTTARIRLREEPNTNCRTLEGINSGVELEVLETLDGWYKVSYNGKTGYVSADYAKIVEE
ncbi:MAG: SH3 domain-containing protein [Agathobacter sp.]|nr:SH3 domain-containing protein [Agathobacter sp.]